MVIVLITGLMPSREGDNSLQRLDRLASIGTLSAGMAHEIKNAFVAVNTFIQDLLEKNRDSELAGLVDRELHRIDTLLSQLLRFAGPAKPTFSPVNVHRILEQSLRLIQPHLEGKQIKLRRALAASNDQMAGDDYQLEQAFINVLLNAVAAMGPHGELGVASEGPILVKTEGRDEKVRNQAYIIVHISDTGHGVSPENLARLFEPFFTTKAHGTGLGLVVTRQIISEHHGKITVDSVVNRGTTFHISLPVTQ